MIEVLLTIFVVLYLILFYIENRNDGRPPGPVRIPPFGNLIQVGMQYKDAHIALHQMAQKYGDVMSVKMGLVETVVLSSYEAVRSMFTRDEALGRFCNGVIWDRNLKRKDIGLGFCTDLVSWSKTRTFCRKTLANYGYGNREAMRTMLIDELTEFLKFMEEDAHAQSNGDRVLHIYSDYFNLPFANIMTTWMTGQRYAYNDKVLQNWIKSSNELIRKGVFGAGLMVAFPFLRFIFPEALGYNVQMRGINTLRADALNFLRERRKTGNYAKNPTCFADDFLRKMDEEVATTGQTNPLFTEDQFGLLFADILQAGMDTTSNVLNFILLQLVANQTVQQKVYQEISEVIGTRIPSIDDKFSMPYTQAVILEGMRWSREIVMGIPREALAPIVYGKYCIKKGTAMMMNLQSIFFEEAFWGDPQVFRPERFFDSFPKLDSKKVERIQLLFSTGKRNCFGEVLARDSIFIFITTLLQKFKFSLPEGSPPPNLEPIVGYALFAHDYDTNLSLR